MRAHERVPRCRYTVALVTGVSKINEGTVLHYGSEDGWIFIISGSVNTHTSIYVLNAQCVLITPMRNEETLTLSLLYTRNREAIEGATRFQKLVFLAQEEQRFAEVFDFEAYKYGPYSTELASTVRGLEARGLVKTEMDTNAYGEERVVYRLTREGIARIREEMDERELDDVFDAVEDIKSTYNDWGTERLLKYVYRKYDEYTTDTDIDLDRLFDPDASIFERRGEIQDTDPSEFRSYIEEYTTSKNTDGTWTARDPVQEFTALGETEAEAIDELGKVIATAHGDAGEPVADEDLEEWGIDPESVSETDSGPLPDFMT